MRISGKIQIPYLLRNLGIVHNRRNIVCTAYVKDTKKSREADGMNLQSTEFSQEDFIFARPIMIS